MRILSVCVSLERGGTDRVVQNFTLAYQRAGHDVAVLSLFSGGPRQQTLESSGIPVMIGFDSASLDRAREFSPDVIHVHRSGAMDADFLEHIRSFRSADRCIVETNFFGRVDRSELGDIIDVHFQLSEWCLWRWHRWLGSDRKKQIGIVVPNTVETADFHRSSPEAISAFRSRLGIDSQAILIGRVGQPGAGKWHPSTIQAFAEVAVDNARAHLVLVGLPDSYRALVDALPTPLRQRVHVIEFLNSDQELCDIYSSLDCFLHSARIGETFGLVLTEAMLCGCPVVTAARPHKDNSHPEVVGHQIGGLVAGSTNHLGRVLHEMVDNADFRRKLRPGLRQWVESRYSADRVAAVALRAATHALAHRDRRKLRAVIEQDHSLQSEVSSTRINELLYHVTGSPSARDLMEMRLRHFPLIERAVATYQEMTLYRTVRRMRRAAKPTRATAS